jgi:hypothetical protein
MNTGKSLYQLAYEKSPIFLVDGIASLIPGNVLPLIAITQAGAIATGLLTGGISAKLDDFFATFAPIPGATLVSNQIGSYPFANQKTAANAIIAQPLTISMKMNITPRLQGAMITRIMIATALKNALDNHNFRGGSYNVLTPTFFYQGCIMTGFKDITSGESKHAQSDWQLDFIQPLISTNEATTYQNALMQKITNGVPSGVLWSGI